jgi:hypothetical protein
VAAAFEANAGLLAGRLRRGRYVAGAPHRGLGCQGNDRGIAAIAADTLRISYPAAPMPTTRTNTTTAYSTATAIHNAFVMRVLGPSDCNY